MAHINLDKLRAEEPRLYRALIDEPGFNDGSDEYSDHLKSQLIAWAENQTSFESPSAPKSEPPAAPIAPTTLRPWQLREDASEAEIRAASFLVRKDLAVRQHAAEVEKNRRVTGTHSIKF